ncbi:hypothetical protein C7M84_023682 [Penaeus vannamei]|uniref:Uncharacterized protein n=2 Tax=Penaeus vannamei TaxID=6689 RepID=A0A423U366_PENVA|nr:uncharacterized protein LOC113799927 [Penaeus vannamei]ROT83145.1 hypothetical protein C7M84_023682 [Penaeus vannamei]
MPRLSLWPNKCRACRGQPTPPPCYQCTFNLQTPPPKYKSLPSHVRDNAHWDRSPSREESAPSFYLSESDVLDEEQEQEIVTRRSFSEFELPRGLSTLAATQQGDLSVQMLAQSLRHIALAFVPADATATQHEAPTPPRRSRHRSSPAFSTSSRHDLLSRRSSGPLVPPHLDRPERPPWATSTTSTSQSSRSSSPGPQNLLSALTSRFSAGSDLYELLNAPVGEPLSPRCSPLPCQLLIPE